MSNLLEIVKDLGWTLNIGRPAGAYWLLGFLIGLPVFIVVIHIMAAGR